MQQNVERGVEFGGRQSDGDVLQTLYVLMEREDVLLLLPQPSPLLLLILLLLLLPPLTTTTTFHKKPSFRNAVFCLTFSVRY